MALPGPTQRLLTIKEFDRAWKAGVYTPDENLELIEGEVYRKVSPQASEHATTIRAVVEVLRTAFSVGFDVRDQLPLELGNRSKPEPDVYVVTGSYRDYTKHHPTTAALVVEVSDTSLRLDRTTKASVYAKAGIEEYWIINLNERMLEVHRKPRMGEGLRSHAYADVQQLPETAEIAPLAAANSVIKVSELLP